MKTFDIQGKSLKLQVWDSLNTKPYLSPLFSRNAAGAIIAVSSKEELQQALEWKEEFER